MNRKIISESVWVVLGQVVSALGALASVRILTEILSREQFGLFVLSSGIVYLVQGMFCTPVLQAVLRFFPDFSVRNAPGALLDASRAIIVRRATLLSSAGVFVGLVAQSFVSLSTHAIVLLNVYLACEMWRSHETNVFNAARRQGVFALLIGADAWAKPLLALAIVKVTGTHVEGVIGGFVSGSILMGISALVMRGRVEARGGAESPDDDVGPSIRRFSRPLIPLALIGWCSGNADRYMIGTILGAGAAGTYAAAYGLVSRPFLMAGQILEQILRQIYYEANTRGDRRLAKKTFGVWLISLVLLSFSGFFAVLWFGDWIARLFLAAEFRDSVVVMPWIAAAYGLFGIVQAMERRFYALYQTGRVLVIEGVGLIVTVVLLPILLPGMGIRGAAIALLVGAVTQLSCTAYVVYSSSRLSR